MLLYSQLHNTELHCTLVKYTQHILCLSDVASHWHYRSRTGKARPNVLFKVSLLLLIDG